MEPLSRRGLQHTHARLDIHALFPPARAVVSAPPLETPFSIVILIDNYFPFGNEREGVVFLDYQSYEEAANYALSAFLPPNDDIGRGALASLIARLDCHDEEIVRFFETHLWDFAAEVAATANAGDFGGRRVELVAEIVFMYQPPPPDSDAYVHEILALDEFITEYLGELNAEDDGGGEVTSEEAARLVDEMESVEYGGEHCTTTEQHCPICLVEYTLASELKRMPCAHLFHGQCVARWLEEKASCPMCRAKVQ